MANQIHVFIVEGTVYTCEEKDAQASLTFEEWEALDKSLQYTAIDNKLLVVEAVAPQAEVIVEESAPLTLPPPLPINMMYEEAGAGHTARLDALWNYVVLQDRTAVDTVIEKRREVEAQHKLAIEEYEATKQK